MKVVFYILLIVCLIPKIVDANNFVDTSNATVFYRSAIHRGFIIPHAEAVAAISHSKPFGIEFSVAKLNSTNADLERYRVYSNTHLTYSYINFDSPSVLGHSHTFCLGFEPLIKPYRNLFGGIRFSAGFSYLSKIYDSISNPQNLFFSLRLSGFLQITPSIHLRITDRLTLLAQASYSHISNGGIRKPNYGMNFPTFGVGLLYFPIPKTLHPINVENKPPAQKHQFSFDIYNSIKVLNNQNRKVTYIWGLISSSNFNLSQLQTLNVSLDLVYQGDIGHEQRIAKPYRITAMGGYQLNLGQIEFLLQLGIYIYTPIRAMDPIYQRYNLKYRMKNNFTVGTFVKAHRHVAEFMGISAGRYF